MCVLFFVFVVCLEARLTRGSCWMAFLYASCTSLPRNKLTEMPCSNTFIMNRGPSESPSTTIGLLVCVRLCVLALHVREREEMCVRACQHTHMCVCVNESTSACREDECEETL